MKFYYSMPRMLLLILVTFMLFSLAGCDDAPPSSDQIQQAQQEKILREGTAEVPMPAIVNFQERKTLKMILELRDQKGLLTYTYLQSEMTGKLMFFCDSIGYGIPYATQYTSPSKIQRYSWHSNYGWEVMPQADPNGLFSPASAEGTYVMCINPDPKSNHEAAPIYVEPRIVVSPFKLPLDASQQ